MERSTWLLSTPACAAMVYAVQELTEVLCQTSEQHKDISTSRVKRDISDAMKVLNFISCRSPSDKTNKSLRSMFTGEIASKSVNAHKAAEVGKRIVEGMEGVPIFDYSYETKLKAITMTSASVITVEGESVHIDPDLIPKDD